MKVFLKFLLQVPLMCLALFGVEHLTNETGWLPFVVTALALFAYTTGDDLGK